MELCWENSILHFILLGGIKSVKLATIHIEMGVERWRTTPSNQFRAIQKTCFQDIGCFIVPVTVQNRLIQ